MWIIRMWISDGLWHATRCDGKCFVWDGREWKAARFHPDKPVPGCEGPHLSVDVFTV